MPSTAISGGDRRLRSTAWIRSDNSAMLTVPVAEYINATAVMNNVDAMKLMTIYDMPERT